MCPRSFLAARGPPPRHTGAEKDGYGRCSPWYGKGRIALGRLSVFSTYTDTFSSSPQERPRNHTGKRLGGRYGPPDPVQAEKQGQDQNRKHLEHQRPQKRDGCRYEAVIQGREEGGGKNVESRQNEGKGKYGKGMPRHLQQLCVIPNENGQQRAGPVFVRRASSRRRRFP